MESISQLNEIEIFKNLDEQARQELRKIFQTRTFPGGNTLFYKNDQSTEVYFVLDGAAKAVLIGDKGEQVVIETFLPYDVFGEMNLFDNKGRSLTVMVEPGTRLGLLRDNDFRNFIGRHPEAALSIIKLLINRLRQTVDMVETISFLKVKERILKSLWQNAEFQTVLESGHVRSPKYTHQEISSLVASSRESVTKCLKALVDEGTITYDKHYFYLIKD